MVYNNKNCVFIRGAARTWNYVKQNSISQLNAYWNNPDFYVLMTDNGTVTEESLQQDFKDVNCVSIKVISHNNIVPFGIESNNAGSQQWTDFSTNYWRVAWYDYVLECEKRKYQLEHDIRYNFTQYIRPDLLLSSGNKPEVEDLYQDIHGIISDGVYNEDSDSFNSNDIVYAAGSRSSILMNYRYFDTYYTDGIPNQVVIGDHAKIAEYMFRNFITYPRKQFGSPGGPFLRPNHIEYYLNHQTDYDMAELDRMTTEWRFMGDEQKQYYCDLFNISKLDFLYKV